VEGGSLGVAAQLALVPVGPFFFFFFFFLEFMFIDQWVLESQSSGVGGSITGRRKRVEVRGPASYIVSSGIAWYVRNSELN